MSWEKKGKRGSLQKAAEISSQSPGHLDTPPVQHVLWVFHNSLSCFWPLLLPNPTVFPCYEWGVITSLILAVSYLLHYVPPCDLLTWLVCVSEAGVILHRECPMG